MHKKDRNESQRSSLYSPHSTFLSAKLILDLVAREMARKHTAFYNIGFSEAKALFRQKLELELIQTQMTQKPMLRAEVYARALRASQNRKEDCV